MKLVEASKSKGIAALNRSISTFEKALSKAQDDMNPDDSEEIWNCVERIKDVLVNAENVDPLDARTYR